MLLVLLSPKAKYINSSATATSVTGSASTMCNDQRSLPRMTYSVEVVCAMFQFSSTVRAVAVLDTILRQGLFSSEPGPAVISTMSSFQAFVFHDLVASFNTDRSVELLSAAPRSPLM